MNSDRLTCIHLEVAINGSTTNPHESAEDVALRQQLAAQFAAIQARPHNLILKASRLKACGNTAMFRWSGARQRYTLVFV